jgi:hypothetical protein
MARTIRILAALMFGGTLLMAQLPNPLGLPDPLGLSKKPAPAPAPRQDGRRVEPRRGNQGKHKGQEKHQEKRQGKGHGKH